MADNLQKKPKKGILKNSSSFDAPDQSAQKKAKNKGTKWDEMNIIATLHPPDKDYGHMKVDEPKTPYNFDDQIDHSKELDANALAEKIRLGEKDPPKVLQSRSVESEDSEDEDLTPEEKLKRKEFEMKRKKHYNEYYAIKLAKKLLEEEEEEEEGSDSGKKVKDKGKGSKSSNNTENDDSSGQSSEDFWYNSMTKKIT